MEVDNKNDKLLFEMKFNTESHFTNNNKLIKICYFSPSYLSRISVAGYILGDEKYDERIRISFSSFKTQIKTFFVVFGSKRILFSYTRKGMWNSM
jgi:hypothetical protein